MKFNSICGAALAATASLYNAVQAQDFATHGIYTEPNTGMKFYGSFQANSATPGQMLDGTSQGGFIEGVALPPGSATTDANEFIGLIVGSTPKGRGQGWAGVTQGHEDQEGFMWAGMVGHLMVVAWPTGTGDEIKSSLRYSVAFEAPVEYKGSARLTPLYSKVNATNWTFIYRCVGCFTFDDTNLDASRRGRAYTSKGSYLKGYAQALFPVDQPSNALSSMAQHDNGAGWYMVDVASAIQPSYSSWITPTTTSRSAGPTTTSTRPVTTTTGRPVTTTTGRPVTTTTTVNTPTTSAGFVSNPVPTTTYDYVVVGSGAGGIPVAEKLAASGKSVLLIERGVASSARHGGTIRPPTGWLDGTNLTWFDVPGQCNRIWNGGSSGVACSDVDQMTGCILGGGTAINAGVWWRPNPKDWDFLFPTGWKASDMAAATARVFARIPGTDLPSMDGKRYLLEGFNVVKSGLLGAGYKQITLNNEPGNKNRTFGHTPYMFANGERGGPQATYLVQSKTRSNFKLWLNTTVDRIERVGGHATGLVVRASNNGGYAGVVKLTPITGRVIVAGGAFGTAKLLFRSGIGPQDQLDVVKASTDGPNMINSTQWIKTPVGYNLDDHLNTDLVLVHPDVKPYNWPASWDAPIEADKQLYFKSRSGPQAQAAPNIGPIIFEEITGTDGIVRQFQWQARVEGSRGVRNDTAMTLSIWAGRGKKSRGRATISPLLNMQVAQIPYGDPADMAALAKAIDNIVAALKPVPGLTWVYPPPGQNGAAYLATIPLNVASVGERRSNHWIGTAKIGTNPGPQGGDAVVDLDTKVYGTDNIFVVDGSIFPGIMTTNPSALIVTVAEKASDRILALPANRALNKFEQCGGLYYSGSMACGTGSSCSYVNDYYSQCL